MGSLLFRVALGAGVATAILGGPTTTKAQPGPGAQAPTDASKRAAKKLVAEAIAAQDTGDYDKAIRLYQQAFALVPHPILLFDIGQAHRLAGRPEQAVIFYENYLALDPNGVESAAARALLATIKVVSAVGIVPKGDPGPVTSKPDETAKPGKVGNSGDLGKASEVGKPGETSAPLSPVPVGQDDPPMAASVTPAPILMLDPYPTKTVNRPGQTLRIAGLVIGGVGLACTAVGGYFTMRVISLQRSSDKAYEMDAPYGQIEEMDQRGHAAERWQIIAYAVGGGLVVGGAVTYFIGYRKDRTRPATALAPAIGPDFAGVAFSGFLP